MARGKVRSRKDDIAGPPVDDFTIRSTSSGGQSHDEANGTTNDGCRLTSFQLSASKPTTGSSSPVSNTDPSLPESCDNQDADFWRQLYVSEQKQNTELVKDNSLLTEKARELGATNRQLMDELAELRGQVGVCERCRERRDYIEGEAALDQYDAIVRGEAAVHKLAVKRRELLGERLARILGSTNAGGTRSRKSSSGGVNNDGGNGSSGGGIPGLVPPASYVASALQGSSDVDAPVHGSASSSDVDEGPVPGGRSSGFSSVRPRAVEQLTPWEVQEQQQVGTASGSRAIRSANTLASLSKAVESSPTFGRSATPTNARGGQQQQVPTRNYCSSPKRTAAASPTPSIRAMQSLALCGANGSAGRDRQPGNGRVGASTPIRRTASSRAATPTRQGNFQSPAGQCSSSTYVMSPAVHRGAQVRVDPNDDDLAKCVARERSENDAAMIREPSATAIISPPQRRTAPTLDAQRTPPGPQQLNPSTPQHDTSPPLARFPSQSPATCTSMRRLSRTGSESLNVSRRPPSVARLSTPGSPAFRPASPRAGRQSGFSTPRRGSSPGVGSRAYGVSGSSGNGPMAAAVASGSAAGATHAPPPPSIKAIK